MRKLLEMGVSLVILLWWFVILLAGATVGIGILKEPAGYVCGLLVGALPLGIGHRYLRRVFEEKLEAERQSIAGQSRQSDGGLYYVMPDGEVRKVRDDA